MRIQQAGNDQENAIKSIGDSPVARALFSDIRWAWIWLILRVYVGWEWISAGWEKLHSSVWTGSQSGTAIAGFVNNALTQASGDHPNVQSWYAWFLQHIVLVAPVFWSFLISWGEFLVGVALIIGIFTGIAAFFGSFMNVNYLLAGSVSINPILFAIATWLVLAWKTAGWWGLDRWVLPALGTPWRPGYILHGESSGTRNTPITRQHSHA